jgi:hypothetical protein
MPCIFAIPSPELDLYWTTEEVSNQLQCKCAEETSTKERTIESLMTPERHLRDWVLALTGSTWRSQIESLFGLHHSSTLYFFIPHFVIICRLYSTGVFRPMASSHFLKSQAIARKAGETTV